MKISKKDKDALNAVITIEIDNKDYRPQVDKELIKYKKSAEMPGFRKGHVPMSLIKKQYEKSLIIYQVNEILQQQLNDFIKKEKLQILGDPIPVIKEDFNWDNDTYTFDFEIGISPDLNISLDTKNKVILYDIQIDDSFVKDEITHLQKQYGQWDESDIISNNSRITGKINFEYHGEKTEKEVVFDLDKLKAKSQIKLLLGKKKGETVKLKSKGLFKDDHDLMHLLHIEHDDVHGFNAALELHIEKIEDNTPAELNEEFYKKFYPEVKDDKAFKEKIKESAKTQLQPQADEKFYNDMIEYLVENTSFDLPGDFLIKWLAQSGEKEMSEEEAKKLYASSEKGLRYQLIENKLIQDNNLLISRDEIHQYTKAYITNYYLQYGLPLPEEQALEEMVQNFMQNEEENKKVVEELKHKKMLDFYKENAQYKTEKTDYKTFVEKSYQ